MTFRLVAPLTTAVSISEVPTITSVEPEGVIEIVMTLVLLLPPQPPAKPPQAAKSKIASR